MHSNGLHFPGKRGVEKLRREVAILSLHDLQLRMGAAVFLLYSVIVSGKELEKKQRVKLQLADMDSNRLRQMTLAIVNYIHRAHKFQLLGLVVEIVEDKDGCLWLNAILGSCWPEEWARRNVLRPDGFMAVDMPASVKATIMGKKIHPGSFAPGDLTRSTVPPRNSDRNTKVFKLLEVFGACQVMDGFIIAFFALCRVMGIS